MRRFITISLGLLLLAGCGRGGGNHSISGTITYKGEPVNGAALKFSPTGENKAGVFHVPVSQDGTFRTDAVPPGEYRVAVEPSTGSSGIPSTQGMDPAKGAEMEAKFEKMRGKPTIPFPEKYRKVGTTDLRCNITSKHQALKFELKD
jgi:hypothetical protein